jgi:DNA-binding PadR family transcriptional regulator
VRAATLLLLAEQPMHGYQLMQAITDRTQGAWRPSPGAIYPTIAQLEDEGLVTTTPDAGRKLVSLTDAGHAYLAEPGNTPVDPFSAITAEGGGVRDLLVAVEEIRSAARTVARNGSAAQIGQARALLDGTRRGLYRILAGVDEADAGDGDEPSA